jgi:NADH-quinone oxidoreductase subunit D
MVCGTRMHTRYFQTGGLAEDIPRGFFPECKRFVGEMSDAIDKFETILTNQKIWLERTVGVGLLSADDAIALGQSGPVLRASGVDWDLRKASPYQSYDEVDFDVPVYENGDVYDRYLVHMDEMRQSLRIIDQALDGMPSGAWIADDRKVVLPPREELHTSMESLIHHFKIVTEGYMVPEGEVYTCVESPRGEFGVYVVSDGGPKPWRVKFRAPSFVALQATATCMTNAAIADMNAIVGSLDGVMGEVDR